MARGGPPVVPRRRLVGVLAPRNAGGLRPRYGLLDDAQRWALDQLRVADQGLADRVLVALYRIVVVGCEYSEATVDLSAETAGELHRQKLVQRRHASRILDPSDDVRFSLMLDDEPC